MKFGISFFLFFIFVISFSNFSDASRLMFASECEELEQYWVTTSPYDFCVGINTAIANEDCSRLDQYGRHLDPHDICLGTKTALRRESCDRLPDHGISASSRDVCIGVEAALLRKPCDSLQDYSNEIGPIDICKGVEAVLNEMSCEAIKELPWITSARDVCKGTTSLAKRDGLPKGTYLESCKDCNFSSDILTCFCLNGKSSHKMTTLDYKNCEGQIENSKGRLICMPKGSYGESCSACSLSSDTLTCSCKGFDHDEFDHDENEETSIQYTNCEGREIQNRNGRLVCFD